jgi:hypothetical protein
MTVAVLTQPAGAALPAPPQEDSAISKNPGNVNWKARRLVIFTCCLERIAKNVNA